jgi:hypothetical protein
MYTSYQNEVENIVSSNEFNNFKTNKQYNGILEHVSFEQGNEYISLIQKTISEDFSEITFENINEYLLLNDKYGSPLQKKFMYNEKQILCSPTSLRYVLHALLILKYLKYTSLTKIVEVGCGYGGLFLAINHFSKILDIKIENYYFVDLPEITKLIAKYLSMHTENIFINYYIHSAYDYGKDIKDENLFFISNYCFTEIDPEHRLKYIDNLFPKIKNGFIIWQTIFNVKIQNVNIIGKEVTKIVEEYPQTAPNDNKNYYVYF